MKRTSGFTLVELLVVIAVIGLLASVVLASLSGSRLKARDAARISDMNQLRIALEGYFELNHLYPLALTDIVPQFMAKIPKDPKTGSNYYYEPTSTRKGYCMGVTLEDVKKVPPDNSMCGNSSDNYKIKR